MIPRAAAATLRRLAGYYPVVALTGPRQSGKTTLARAVFAHKPYVSLEDPDTRHFAQGDPRRFLAQYPDGAVIDEAQRVPDLFSYLQTRVDAERKLGQFVLTGSQQFGLLSGISQTLAGRVGLVHLLPFCLTELATAQKLPDLETMLWRGQYPPVIDRAVPPGDWYADYVATYIERDVRQMVNVRDLGTFRRFVRMCAARTGQTLNLSGLAADCGITHNTAKAWISILEASYVLFLLPPHARSFGKRLVKAPKLYFYDCGLAAWLAGVQSAGEIGLGAMRGPLFETWAVAEFVKFRANRALSPALYFWRNNHGDEIDLLVDRGELLYPVEFKAGQTIAGDWLAPLQKFLRLAAGGEGALLYGGATAQARESVSIHGWKEIESVAGRAFGVASANGFRPPRAPRPA